MVNTDDGQLKQEVYDKLYTWQRICYQAANITLSHYFAQDRLKDFFYLTEEVQYKLADRKKEANGMFCASRMNTVYSVLSKKFKGAIPMSILSALGMQLFKAFTHERNDYFTGEKSLRNYKKNIPIPFGAANIKKLRKTNDNREFEFSLFRLPFRTYLGRDAGDKRLCLESLLTNNELLKTSSIQLKKGKIYLLGAFVHHIQKPDPDKGIIAEASLSIEVPVVVKIKEKRFEIGSKEDFLYKRLAIQSAIMRIQKATTCNCGGHGKLRKTKPLLRFKEKEKNFVNTTLHLYSTRLIRLCQRYNVGTLMLMAIIEDKGTECEKEAAEKSRLMLRNWSYFSLMSKIQYKAAKAGIEVIKE